jgi:hypothetical protein
MIDERNPLNRDLYATAYADSGRIEANEARSWLNGAVDIGFHSRSRSVGTTSPHAYLILFSAQPGPEMSKAQQITRQSLFHNG